MDVYCLFNSFTDSDDDDDDDEGVLLHRQITSLLYLSNQYNLNNNIEFR